jgi:flavin reductase (DIM6/NTAB) family NADH-FMN oxidoreductase RutF
MNGSGPDGPAQDGVSVVIDEFREAMSRVPMAVTIVTAFANGRAHGTTVSAFCSLSLDPPMVLITLGLESDLLALLPETGRFSVNLLAVGQHELGRACARKGIDKLAMVPWANDHGLPRIKDAAAWLACEIQDFLPAGDHMIVTGLVTLAKSGTTEPIVYHRRDFRALTPASAAK